MKESIALIGKIFLLMAIILLVSCFDKDAQMDKREKETKQKLEKIFNTITTMKEVEKKFGPPTFSDEKGGGIVLWTYVFDDKNIPIGGHGISGVQVIFEHEKIKKWAPSWVQK